MTQISDDKLLTGVPEISEEVNLGWHPILGRRVEKEKFVAFSLPRTTLKNDPCFHIFPKRSTHLAVSLNIGNDEYIASKMIPVLEERYGEGNVKVTFFGRYSKNYKVVDPTDDPRVHGACFCVVYKDSPFTSTQEYEDQTLSLLANALSEKSFQ